MNETIVTVEIGDTTYTLKKHLDWYEAQRAEQRQFRMFVSGQALEKSSQNLDEIDEVEIRMCTAEYNLARLQARLCGLSGGRIRSLPSAHVQILLDKIAELEQGEAEEVRKLSEENPTEKRLSD